MIDEKRIAALRELLPYIYFVGVGYWPSEEAFALGIKPPEKVYLEDFFSYLVMDIEISRLRPFAPAGWKLIFFIITKGPGRTQVTREEAEWILNNRASY